MGRVISQISKCVDLVGRLNFCLQLIFQAIMPTESNCKEINILQLQWRKKIFFCLLTVSFPLFSFDVHEVDTDYQLVLKNNGGCHLIKATLIVFCR